MSLIDPKLPVGSFISLLRSKAAEFNAFADQLEESLQAVAQPLATRTTSRIELHTIPTTEPRQPRQKARRVRKSLTPQERKKFLSLHQNGWTAQQIASDFGRHSTTVHRVIAAEAKKLAAGVAEPPSLATE